MFCAETVAVTVTAASKCGPGPLFSLSKFTVDSFVLAVRDGHVTLALGANKDYLGQRAKPPSSHHSVHSKRYYAGVRSVCLD